MKGAIVRKKNQSDQTKSFLKFVLLPLRAGLLGFSIFLIILIVTKWISYLIGTNDNLTIDVEDVYLSVIGFILLFLIKFLENFKEE